ncbi:MAG: hypothetical protein ACLQPV_03915 [Vulcanimicrobiaceae bacterium]
MRTPLIVAAALVAAASILQIAPAAAAPTFTNGTVAGGPTLPSGTQIVTVLHQGIDSETVTPGTNFSLLVQDPSQPSLAGAKIVGHVTGVTQPAGLTRARIAFLIDYIHFANGTREPIRARVLSSQVVARNTAQTYASQITLPPMGTPAPVAWQMNIPLGRGASSQPATLGTHASNSGSTGGFINGRSAGASIKIPAGTSVTLELLSSLPTP